MHLGLEVLSCMDEGLFEFSHDLLVVIERHV
jgi:hypothetical protein